MDTRCSLPMTHLDRMSDSAGLIQHAIYSLPRRESGYTTDDNARALRLCVRLWTDRPDHPMLARVACYLSFLEHARAPVRGFHNFMSYQSDWLDAGGTGDCQGQAVLALAEVLSSPLPAGFRDLARELIDSVLEPLSELRSLRAQAYTVQAWTLLWRAGIDRIGPMEVVARLAADRLVEYYHRSRRDDWAWFESRMTYANAVLPHAMFDAAQRWPDAEFLSVAEESFAFLDDTTTADGVFQPIGNHEWYSRGEERSLYDQQPVEASTMASAALAGSAVVGGDRYIACFERARNWFRGGNSLCVAMADPEDGSCMDGIHPQGPNCNQGAESTLAYLWTELLSRTDSALIRAANSNATAVA